jgi:protein TonB
LTVAEQDVVLEVAQREPFVPVKRVSALAIVGLSASALVHGMALFALLQLEPAPAVGVAQEIPVDIIVEANAPEPTAVQAPPPAQAKPAEIEPQPSPTPTTAENAPPPAPPENAAPISPPSSPPPQAAPSEPEPRPPPAVAPVPAADAAVEAVAPPQEPIAAPSPTETAHAEPQRREELQRRAREEAEAKKQEENEAAARKRAYEKKREEMRAATRAAAARDREAALERSAAAAAPSRFTPAPRSDRVDYRSAVLRHLSAFTHYPESARVRGVHGQTIIAFTIDAAGHVVSARILRSSGQADIDAETLAMVRRADPFPVPPPGAERSFSPAIEFHLE